MRAIVVSEFGGPERLELVELPDPRPGSGEVLLAITAAGVNRADVLARAGGYHRVGRPPLRLGLEGAGVVTAVGGGVSGLAVGQQVVAFGAINAPGFYAEMVTVPVERVVAVPDGIDLTAAAALPTAWLTAWYCLRRLAQVRPGDRVLVHAGASGVGSAAVAIAVDAGATVIATARSANKAAWVARLGAHEVLDTSELESGALADRIRDLTGGHGADVVLDTVGGATFADSLRVVGHAGCVVALANVALEPSVIDTRDFYPKNVRILGFQITSLIEHGYDPRADLRDLVNAVATGRFTVPVDATFPMARVADAHRRLEQRENRGKVMLTLTPG